MPVTSTGQGDSPNTPVKQQSLRYFLQVHAGVVRAITSKYAWADPQYYFIDVNAGTGLNEDGTPGSVLIAQDMIAHSGLTLHGVAIEKRAEAVELLEKRVSPVFRILHGDNAALVRATLIPPPQSNKYGLVYCDPNGVDDLPLDALRAFFSQDCPQTRRVDVLISLGANHLKRCRAAGLEKYGLPDILTRIPKQHWFIREGYWHDQWTLLFGTNFAQWPALALPVETPGARGLASLGMHNVLSLRGRRIWDTLTKTRAELRAEISQLSLLTAAQEHTCLR